MGSDMWKQHLRKTVQYLAAFETKPKAIEGRVVTEWFSLGEDIFAELYKLGDSLQWKFASIKTAPETSEVVSGVTRNEKWLQSFISYYPSLRIDLDLSGSAGDICRVRSGIEVLLRGFTNIDTRFDKVLKDLEEEGEVDELDRCLKIWRNTGHRPDFAAGDRKPNIPETHWWWH